MEQGFKNSILTISFNIQLKCWMPDERYKDHIQMSLESNVG